jgi:hypothetical protein
MLLNNLSSQPNQLIALDSKESNGTFVKSEISNINSSGASDQKLYMKYLKGEKIRESIKRVDISERFAEKIEEIVNPEGEDEEEQEKYKPTNYKYD